MGKKMDDDDDKPQRVGGRLGDTDEPKIIVGIDPGKNNALVALSLISPHARAWMAPLSIRQGVAIPRLPSDLLRLETAPIVFIEHLHGRKGWQAKATFGLGGSMIAMAALCVAKRWPIYFVRPMAWRKAMGVRRGNKNDDESTKDRTRARFDELFPNSVLPLSSKRARKINHNLTDAMMIAAYGVQHLGYQFQQWKFQPYLQGAVRIKSMD
jgi:hypothetical protein